MLPRGVVVRLDDVLFNVLDGTGARGIGVPDRDHRCVLVGGVALGAVDGRVELAHWKSSLLKRLEDLKSVATDDEIRQVVQSFAALEAETESRECSFEEFIAASGLPPAQAVPEIGMPTDAVRKLLQEIFESIAEESGEGKLEDFRAELKTRLQEGLGLSWV